MKISIILAVAMVISAAGLARAQAPVPEGYQIPDSTLSPKGRYGVLVPDTDYFIGKNSEPARGNQLIEVRTGRVVCDIQGETGWTRQNHGGIAPTRWSVDGTMLLWQVDGKWAPETILLIKLENGKAKWQINILETAQQAILARTRKADPQKYAAIKKAHQGWGEAYPDGFTVYVTAGDDKKPLVLPMAVQVSLTSDPKEIDPRAKQLNSTMDGIVDVNGKFTVTKFQIEH